MYEIQQISQGVRGLSCFVEADILDVMKEACRMSAAKQEEFDNMEYDGPRSKLITRKSGKIIIRNIQPYEVL